MKKYNFSINFNLHPLAKDGFKDYFSTIELKKFTISKNTIAQDILESRLLIFKYGTNSILDCVALGKYPIELWSLRYKKFFVKSVYQNKNLSIKCEDSKKLEKLIKSSFKKKNSLLLISRKKIIF